MTLNNQTEEKKWTIGQTDIWTKQPKNNGQLGTDTWTNRLMAKKGKAFNLKIPFSKVLKVAPQH
jgi:hypothetical protein